MVAPPWTLATQAAFGQASRSRRMVMSETPNSDARSLTRTPPCGADQVEDRRLSLLGEHQVTTAPGRGNRTISNTGEHYLLIRSAQKSDLYRFMC